MELHQEFGLIYWKNGAYNVPRVSNFNEDASF